jgi:hypothetical protein
MSVTKERYHINLFSGNTSKINKSGKGKKGRRKMIKVGKPGRRP